MKTTFLQIQRIVMLALILVGLNSTGANAAHPSFSPGDVIVSSIVATPFGEIGQIRWFHPDGTLNKEIFNLFSGSGHPGEGVFGLDGLLYVPFPPTILVFDGSGAVVKNFGFIADFPVSVVFDASGNLYVALLLSPSVLKFDQGGRLIDRFDLPFSYRTPRIDLGPDQCTLYYTTLRGDILRYDVCNDRPLPSVTVLADGPAIAIRLLANGEILVANVTSIVRLDPSGRILQRYDVPGADEWGSLDMNSDGQSFWAASGDKLYKFDLASGSVLIGPVTLDSSVHGPPYVAGIAVAGALRAALVAAASSIPTVSEWGLFALAFALGGIAIIRLR